MNKLIVLAVAGVVLAAGGYWLATSGAAAGTQKPNIILISIDSLRPDHLGCYGYDRETSPTIDQLAAQGARFSNAVSTTTWTLPAHAAMMTGLYDSTHGVYTNGKAICDEHITLAEELKKSGYETAGFFGGPYLHPLYGFAQGFDRYQNCMTPLKGDNSWQAVREDSHSPNSASHDDITGPRTRDAVKVWMDWLDGQAAEGDTPNPYFAFIHLWDVHYDYIPPQKYIDMFDPGYAGTVDGRNFMSDPAVNRGMSPIDLRHVIACYDGEIRSTDDIIKQILDDLKSRGRMENTLVIITADHGEEFFEHGNKGHQQIPWEETVKIPLIMYWPGRIEANRTIEDQVRIIDIMPTALAAAGEQVDHPIEGRDISPLLRGEPMEPGVALAELLVDGADVRALRTNEEKIFRQVRDGKMGYNYFELAKDPGERSPARAWTPAADAAIKRIEAEVLEAEQFKTRLAAPAAGCEADVSEEAQSRLSALGYGGVNPEESTSPDAGADDDSGEQGKEQGHGTEGTQSSQKG